MEYSQLGKTGRKVSRIGFGGATAGLKNYIQVFDPGKKEDRKPLIAGIRRALELGINYFDTAPAYGNGSSEEIFGESLEGVPEESVFLATKFTLGIEGMTVRKSVEASLKRLRRGNLDLLQLHGTVFTADQERAIFDSGGYLDQLVQVKREGLTKHVGFSVEAQDPVMYRLIESGVFDCMQVCYNLIFQHPYDPGWKCGSMYDAEQAGLGIIAMRSATSGIFQKWIRKVNPADKFDYTPSLIQFELSNPLVDVALVGMRNIRQVEENVRIADDLSGRIDLDELFQRYV
jgi:hypothetical protein